jgi:hypothetical protein
MPAYGGQFLTNTALPTDPFGLWTVHFGDGSPADATKYGFFGSVRAVRGGR